MRNVVWIGTNIIVAVVVFNLGNCYGNRDGEQLRLESRRELVRLQHEYDAVVERHQYTLGRIGEISGYFRDGLSELSGSIERNVGNQRAIVAELRGWVKGYELALQQLELFLYYTKDDSKEKDDP